MTEIDQTPVNSGVPKDYFAVRFELPAEWLRSIDTLPTLDGNDSVYPVHGIGNSLVKLAKCGTTDRIIIFDLCEDAGAGTSRAVLKGSER